MRRPGQTVWVTAVVAAGASLLTGCALIDPHSQFTIAMLMEDEGYDVDVTTNSANITDEACGPAIECVEAYSTDEANYYRFVSREAATDYESTLDDSFSVHYIVMDFAGKDDSSKEQQQWAMERLAGAWQDYDGKFPDRGE